MSPDDPADHRGILSWHAQLKDKQLREAGPYGDPLELEVPREALESAAPAGPLEIRLEVDAALREASPSTARRRPLSVDPTVRLHQRQ